MATLLESLAAPYFHSTHPFLRLDKLEVGALYIMISIPLPIFMGRKKHVYEAVMSTDPDFPFDTYEGMVSDGLSSEEFYWDLYWHTSSTPRNEDTPEDEGGGVLYRLRKEPACPQTVIYDRLHVVRPRSHVRLVGLVRVVSVPGVFVPHMTEYLDWLTCASARAAHRSFLWATMATYRVRRHLLRGEGVSDHSFHQFDISRFTTELLSFAYTEAHNTIAQGGDGAARPAIASYSDEAAETRRKRDELLRLQFEQFGYVKAQWF
ncbi:hypothetical protein CH63R_11497 [Colletotrichum higginsianum IMI 349063]|uniref:Uncharacterized protein n=3 Tax=Colletotrichum higginsianum TaxID=80884 RepID=A0A1B7XYG7_COLHI|nr:hypothetical protein CH63R_11497 [Colletotrichum higginsianum IMI 349063]OBR04794.1 hypothetical protein CH63R_11497 [Colletotrichum higginsianum IMI 349063]